MPAELRYSDMRHHCRRRHAAVHHPRRGGDLNHTAAAVSAGILGTDRSDHPQDGRHHVEGFTHIFADPVQRTRAARTNGALRLNHPFAAQQMPWQGADVARSKSDRNISKSTVLPHASNWSPRSISHVKRSSK